MAAPVPPAWSGISFRFAGTCPCGQPVTLTEAHAAHRCSCGACYSLETVAPSVHDYLDAQPARVAAALPDAAAPLYAYLSERTREAAQRARAAAPPLAIPTEAHPAASPLILTPVRIARHGSKARW